MYFYVMAFKSNLYSILLGQFIFEGFNLVHILIFTVVTESRSLWQRGIGELFRAIRGNGEILEDADQREQD